MSQVFRVTSGLRAGLSSVLRWISGAFWLGMFLLCFIAFLVTRNASWLADE